MTDAHDKRLELQVLLEKYESGKLSHYDENGNGELKLDVTSERISSLKVRIAELDRKIAETGSEVLEGLTRPNDLRL